MKKTVCFLICCLLFLIFNDSASAQSNYDYRDVTDFQTDILADIYNSSTKSHLPSNIDFTKAVKTYNFTPKDLLDNISNDTLLLSLKDNTNYSWKVPIATRADGYDYAVISKNTDGNLSIYTASTTNDGAQQVNYIFNQTQISEIISRNQINDVQNLYALSISQINMDLIVIDYQNTIDYIPFASRADLLEVDNGSLYTSVEISDVLNKYIKATNNNQFLYIAVPFVLVIVVLFVGVLLIKRKYKSYLDNGS